MDRLIDVLLAETEAELSFEAIAHAISQTLSRFLSKRLQHVISQILQHNTKAVLERLRIAREVMESSFERQQLKEDGAHQAQLFDGDEVSESQMTVTVCCSACLIMNAFV